MRTSVLEPLSLSPTHGDEAISELDRASGKETARVLIVDDESVNLRVAEAFLQDDGYQNIILCDAPETVPSLIQRHAPDVILLDVMMPRISGLDLLQSLRSDPRTRHLPVIVLTAVTDRETKCRALQLGATDFLLKPIDSYELLPRVRNALVLRAYQRNLENQASMLEAKVRRRTTELTWTRIQIIHSLARACEYRDNETGRHALRVGRSAQLLAEEMGQEPQWCENLLLSAMLHDVGKIGVRDAVLLKPGRLTSEEFSQMQEHCRFGEEIIAPFLRSELLGMLQIEQCTEAVDSELLLMAARIAATHHEHWDGSGYPKGLRGEQIPIEGRITAVADVFDALGSERPYKPAYSLERCREIIAEGSGSHFDPRVVEAFMARFDDLAAVREQLKD